MSPKSGHSGKEELLVLRAGDPAKPVADAHGQFHDFIRARVGDAWGRGWRVHDVREDAPLPSDADVDRAAAIFVTGSSSSVTEHAPWMARTSELLVRAVERGVPLMGLCFGHQLIAEAFGGRVEKNPRGREIGTQRARTTPHVKGDRVFFDYPDAFDVQTTHVDTVVDLPPGATLLMSTDLEPHAAFSLGERVWCVQFHPEFDAAIMRDYVRARAHLIDQEGGSSARTLENVQSAPFAERMLADFVTRVVHPSGR